MPRIPDPDLKNRLLDHVALVLSQPKYPENIGAAARIARNMGISRLIIVKDEPPDREKMLKMATHEASGLIDRMEQYESLTRALAPFSCVVGTTSRQGRKRRIENTPRKIISTLLPLLQNNRVALLFGPEDRGLTNYDLKYCQLTVTIPSTDFSSLNLAQAVGILCYELYCGTLLDDEKQQSLPKLASTQELEGMYDHVEKLLNTIGFLKTADSAYWMRNIRSFLGRIGLRAKEARIIRGFCRQFLWYEKQRRKSCSLLKNQSGSVKKIMEKGDQNGPAASL